MAALTPAAVFEVLGHVQMGGLLAGSCRRCLGQTTPPAARVPRTRLQVGVSEELPGRLRAVTPYEPEEHRFDGPHIGLVLG